MSISNLAMVSLHSPQLLYCQPGDIVPYHPDSCWQIKKGLVRTLTWTEEGDLVTLGLWGIGNYIGQLLSEITPFQIECISPLEMETAFLTGQPLTMVLRSHLRQTEELFSIISHKRASQRLLEFLAWLGRRFGRQLDQGQLIDLGLTHQLLAEITGITRVTVTRLLTELEQQGELMRLPKQQILLHRGFGRSGQVARFPQQRRTG
ncbi:MAG: Crp/Fnr family transcriptional regulator [Acaryochloridaceae cyanobacterium SU_2_1]|nr:Crp/Fnr family transcriptional regulator [Acaryochloridaceae cyanobacterium SU_2_1]